jgi:hypothetical protein
VARCFSPIAAGAAERGTPCRAKGTMDLAMKGGRGGLGCSCGVAADADHSARVIDLQARLSSTTTERGVFVLSHVIS